MPHAFYKILRTPGMEDPSPIIADSNSVRPSQEQMVQPLLCADCEDLLNKNGERWVLSNCYRIRGPSPLYTILSNALPDPSIKSGTAYSALVIPEIDLDKLTYFGASIFWRASAADWKFGGKKIEMSRLGRKYDEQFRKYLNGEAGFPENAVLWIAVVRSEHPSPVIFYPVGERVESYHRHTFDVLGLSYMLFLGGSLPQQIRQFCAIRSPQRYIFFTDIDQIIDRNARKLMNSSKPSRRLLELAKRDHSELPQIIRDQMTNFRKSG